MQATRRNCNGKALLNLRRASWLPSRRNGRGQPGSCEHGRAREVDRRQGLRRGAQGKTQPRLERPDVHDCHAGCGPTWGHLGSAVLLEALFRETDRCNVSGRRDRIRRHAGQDRDRFRFRREPVRRRRRGPVHDGRLRRERLDHPRRQVPERPVLPEDGSRLDRPRLQGARSLGRPLVRVQQRPRRHDPLLPSRPVQRQEVAGSIPGQVQVRAAQSAEDLAAAAGRRELLQLGGVERARQGASGGLAPPQGR